MDYQINAQEYRKLIDSMYKLIVAEIDNVKDVEEQYPRFCTMYEFFRMLRGEAFLDLREHDPEVQPLYYKMEDEIFEKLKKLKETIPAESSKAKYLLENNLSIGLRLS